MFKRLQKWPSVSGWGGSVGQSLSSQSIALLWESVISSSLGRRVTRRKALPKDYLEFKRCYYLPYLWSWLKILQWLRSQSLNSNLVCKLSFPSGLPPPQLPPRWITDGRPCVLLVAAQRDLAH